MGEWVARYERWEYEVFRNEKTLTPTPQQAVILGTVHMRVLKEEYELAGEAMPEQFARSALAHTSVERPLLRLVHGLPGSGKSMVIIWLKQYFEDVWQWTRNKQYALIAPMNTMADNIGGSTMHSFGRIPFKDRRGMFIQSGGDNKAAGLLGSATDWH